jgi:phospholipid/cholesterol/gamma-HCH transport system substrate-binding protein
MDDPTPALAPVPPPAPPSPPAPPPRDGAADEARLEAKAALLLLALALLLAGSFVYLLYARGAFEQTQSLVLVADDSEGVKVGMDMTFSGFPIGRVRRIALGEDGSARITVDVPLKDARWLRQSSVFVLTRGLVGGTTLRAYSGVLDDPPLAPGAERQVLVGDASAEIPRLVASARELVANLSAMTGAEAELARTLGELRRFAERLNGQGGLLGVALGDDAQARRVSARLEAAVGRADALLARIDGVVARTDERVLGPDGVLRDVQGGVADLRALLADTRGSVERLNGVLDEVRAIAGDVRGATTDLDALRAEVETSLRRIDHLIQEVNRKWPFARETELKLP